MKEKISNKSTVILSSLREEQRIRLANRMFDVILFSLKTDQIAPSKARQLVDLYREEGLSSREGLELLVDLAQKYEPDLASHEILSIPSDRKTGKTRRSS